MTPQTLRAIIGDDLLLRDMLDDALRGRQGERTDLVDNINKVDRPDGTSKDRALRKLRTDAPELHEKVLAGELTPHAAMVQAGFRHRTFTARADDTEALARTLLYLHERRTCCGNDISRRSSHIFCG